MHSGDVLRTAVSGKARAIPSRKLGRHMLQARPVVGVRRVLAGGGGACKMRNVACMHFSRRLLHPTVQINSSMLATDTRRG
jgi:hypothetical protein